MPGLKRGFKNCILVVCGHIPVFQSMLCGLSIIFLLSLYNFIVIFIVIKAFMVFDDIYHISPGNIAEKYQQSVQLIDVYGYYK